MATKKRVRCKECETKFVVSAAAEGKRVKCPSCGNAVRVPVSPSGQGGDDPYQSTVPQEASGLPPRVKKKKKGSGKKSSGGSQSSGDKPGSRMIRLGAGIFFGAIISNVVMMTVMGPTPNTAEGRGRAVGQGLVVVLGIIVGVVMMIRGYLANRAGKR